MRENYGIGILFLGTVTRRYKTGLTQEQLEYKLNKLETHRRKNDCLTPVLTFFQIMFPFGHFAKIKARIVDQDKIEVTISPIVVRVIQLSLITLYSITLSAVRLYDNRSWKVLAILSLHFAVLCTIWWIIRLVYVADARQKMSKFRRNLRLINEV